MAIARFFTLILIMLAASANSVTRGSETNTATAPPKRLLVPRLSGKVSIDGELKEKAWRKARHIDGLFRNDGTGTEREHTEVFVWYDQAALYLGWICRDIDIQATLTNRDSKFWEEEVVEFFVAPRELNRYYELQWNPLGGVFDAIITNTLDSSGVSIKFEGDWSYTARGMRSAVKLRGTPNNSDDRDEYWQVEVRLPFVDLGVPAPRPGEIWRANFYRFNRTRNLPVEELSWSPTLLPGFHQPSRFGYLEFGK